MSTLSFDHIIVGAGSAGCALAHRLSVSAPSRRILLLEAGGKARNPLLHIPLGFAFLLKPNKHNWNYSTLPEPWLNQRCIELPRGKVMGGCSAINGMVYVRGQAADYDHWAALGNNGWAYADVLPLFTRSENCENGSNAWHGTGGRLWVGNVHNEFPVCDDFIAACVEAGHSANADINGATQSGASFFPNNIRNGKRLSSASAFLNEAPPNLTVISHVLVNRVLIENGTVRGVECLLNNQRVIYRTDAEVILCGGAINSPQILERSGIGQADRLQKLGINVAMDLPGVGENLHDHWNAYIKCHLAQGKTYYSESKPLAMLRNLFRYLVFRQGFLANPAALVTVFYNALDDSERPDAQIHFAPAASEPDKDGNLLPIDGITVATCGLRPTSRGHTHITRSDAKTGSAIQVNYLQTAHDQRVAVEAFRKARDILATKKFQTYGSTELSPGNTVQTDADILDYIRNTGDPVHHLAGSCKMGSDAMSVVDETLRVHGIRGLRVADASIMPEIVSGNTHAACVMIGEKAADCLLKEHH